MLFNFKNHFHALAVFFVSSLLLFACTFKNGEQQIRQLLQQSDSVLWQSKSQAKVYAQQAFNKAVEIKDMGLQAKSLLRLANAVRVNTRISVLLGYDSAAVATARQAKDSIILFRGLDAYARDLLTVNEVVKADSLLKEEKIISSLINDSVYQAAYLYTSGLFCFKSVKYEEAKQDFEAGLQIAEKNGDAYLAAQSKVKIFSANQYLGIQDTTGKLVLEAIGFFQRNQYSDDEAIALFTAGENYRYIGNTQKAKEYYLKAQQVLNNDDNYLIAFTINNGLFMVSLSREKMDSASMAVSAMGNYADSMDYKAGKSLTQIFWGQYYTASGEFTKAESAFNQADSLAKLSGFAPLGMMVTMYRTVLFDKQHKVKESDSAAISSYGAIQRMVSPKLIQRGYTNKDGKQYNDDEKRLMLDSTYLQDSGMVYLKKIRAQNDSTESPIYKPLLSAFDSSTAMSFSRQADEIEAQYKNRILSDSLQLQKQQVLLNQSEINRKNITLAATAALLLLVAAGGFLQYRSRQRAVRDKQRIELLQNEIHHRVKNNLAVINRLVEVAGKNSVEDAPLAALKNRIKSIELLHNHLYSEKAAAGNIALQPYFEDLSLAIAATFHSAKNIAISVDAPAEVDSTIAEKLGLIVNELVTNSYKYAFENKEDGKVSITARQQNGMLNLQVADNGIGLPETKARNSYGMKLIKGLSHEIKGQFSFHNSNGTRFEIAIPLTA